MAKWHLLDSVSVLSTPWLSVYKNQYDIGDGKIVDDFYIVQRSDFVLVIANRNHSLILVRQYRPATDQFYLSLPAGYISSGESPEEAAKRELLEETGYSAKKCELIGELHPLPGYIQSSAFVFLCEGILDSNARSIDSSEISEVVEATWTEVLEMIVQGTMKEMQAVAAILMAKEYLQKHGLHDDLKE